jgi:hypothetical protein
MHLVFGLSGITPVAAGLVREDSGFDYAVPGLALRALTSPLAQQGTTFITLKGAFGFGHDDPLF